MRTRKKQKVFLLNCWIFFFTNSPLLYDLFFVWDRQTVAMGEGGVFKLEPVQATVTFPSPTFLCFDSCSELARGGGDRQRGVVAWGSVGGIQSPTL